MMERQNIRNFSIIAHIDHGKSTLADRMLELTDAVEARVMQPQYLDQMDLERERGITIKMQPVRMIYKINHAETLNAKLKTLNKSQNSNPIIQHNLGFRASDLGCANSTQGFVLNLIDTPGHIDFSYEVSRALRAVEGAILLVDATQGVEAQTLHVLELARKLDLVIIPVINKIDLAHARIPEAREELAALLGPDSPAPLEVSAKTGEGVEAVLEAIVTRIPAPRVTDAQHLRALVFDFSYSSHKGAVAYVRVFDGELSRGKPFRLARAEVSATAAEVGVFLPKETPVVSLKAGEIGYVVTQIKEPRVVRVGDTLVETSAPLASLEGYQEPVPMIWASIYPSSQDVFELLRKGLETLHLSDSALFFEEESSGVLGRGFRCGFLGMLHLEIVIERLRREHQLDVVVTSPTVVYEVEDSAGIRTQIYAPHRFPQERQGRIFEPWVRAEIFVDERYLGAVMRLLHEYEGILLATEHLRSGRLRLDVEMPLRELMRNFFDRLKSISSGYASFSYEVIGRRLADVVRVDILVAGETIPAFARIVGRKRVEEEAETLVSSLAALLPRQQFEMKIQAEVGGRILRSRSVSALRKNVTGNLYGGDRTRKMKLWQKQKKGKKRLKTMGKVQIPEGVFLKMVSRH